MIVLLWELCNTPIEGLQGYIYSEEQNKDSLDRNRYNSDLVTCEYFRLKCRFVFREFFVAPVSNSPQNYDDYIKSQTLKHEIVERIKRDIEKDTGAPIRSGGFDRFGNPSIGCCKILTEFLSLSVLKSGSVDLDELKRFETGVSVELAAAQYACNWFSRECVSVSQEGLSRAILKVKSTNVGRITCFQDKKPKLDDLLAGKHVYKISFEVGNKSNQHQVLMHITKSLTFIVDPNIGLLSCNNERKIFLLNKIIDNYPFYCLGQREIRIDRLEMIEGFNHNWRSTEVGFLTYSFEKNI